MKKSFIYSMAALLVAGAAFTACSSSENDIENGQPEAKKYTLTVQAEKGDYVTPSATRTTLSPDAQGNLQAYWENNKDNRDYVDVYHGDAYVGTLYAQSDGSASTLLTGEVSGSFNGGEELTLKFNDIVDIAAAQDGSLDRLGKNYIANATVKISSINGSEIRTSKALFVAQCAIVRLNLNHEVYTLTMTVGTGSSKKTYNTGIITMPTNQVWFAVYGFDSQDVNITANAYGYDGTYSYFKNATVKNGDFYDITVDLN